jgi:phytoene dehydrogenase-like protein
MLDVVIIGSGPNGLVAAATLARAGLQTLVCEAQQRVGGALGSMALTEPGFIHDVGAGFFPFGAVSPGLVQLDLPGTGLRWKHAAIDSAHVGADGHCGVVARDTARTVALLGRDGEAWERIATWNASLGDRLIRALIAPLPGLKEALKISPIDLLRFAAMGLSTAADFGERTFVTEGARRIAAGLALHADLGPDDFTSAAVGMTLALLAAKTGFPVPEGGAESITRAICTRITEAGGAIRSGARIQKVIVREKRVVAVRLQSGEEIPTRAVLADTGPRALALDLVGHEHLPGRLTRAVKGFKYAWGTFKLDWALDGPVPWTAAACREAAVVHVAENLAGMRAFTNEVREGRLPERPYLLVGQQSIADPTRAPPGKHTLYGYTHVPSTIPAGWRSSREAFADRVEGWIESCAPGFRKLIRGRSILAPPELEAMNENLVGGDLGGGTAQIQQQLFFRPAFPYFRYRLPVGGLYLGSASTHPGTGVHGACGYNAACALLDDLHVSRERT